MLYAAHATPFYWIVDPPSRTIESFQLGWVNSPPAGCVAAMAAALPHSATSRSIRPRSGPEDFLDRSTTLTASVLASSLEDKRLHTNGPSLSMREREPRKP